MKDPKVVSIHQPSYLPWLGYFEKIARSDIHVVFDTVQFEKNSFLNRNKIKTSQGWCWLTVPVLTKGKFSNVPLTTLQIDPKQKWAPKHLKSITSNYRKARDYEKYIEGLRPFYEGKEWELLASLNIEMLKYFLNELNIDTEIVHASDLNIEGTKSDLVLNICKHLGAAEYISGKLGQDYLDEESFKKAGISITYQDYSHPEYPQLFEEFQPYMGIIDLLMNCGKQSKDILLENNYDNQEKHSCCSRSSGR